MLRKLFNMYSTENNGCKVLTFRQITAFLKDFKFFDVSCFKKLDLTTAQLIFNQRVPKRLCDFKGFIEVLYKISKIEICENPNKDENFKKMMDRILIQKYKELSVKVCEYNLNKIQIFYQQYDDEENPVVLLLYQNDDLLKHVKKLENIFFKFNCLKNRFSQCMNKKISRNQQIALFL